MSSFGAGDVGRRSTLTHTGDGGTILFDVPATRLADFVAELRRLLIRPVHIQWLPTGDEAPGRALVRVENPPQLILWRIIDEPPGPSAIVAYAEQSPDVWVEYGGRMERAPYLEAPAGRILLVRHCGDREELDCGLFETENELRMLPVERPARATVPPVRLPVRLRLKRGDAPDSPRLWVVRHDALAQLTAYCRTVHQQLLSRFTVAVSAAAGAPCVVLRAISAKGPPPVFVGPATAYCPLARLPNLFLPAGTRLVPPLRNDALRAALGIEPDRVAWLHPTGDNGFQQESIAASAFQPLSDWVDYRVFEPNRLLTHWAQSPRWAFDSFAEQVEATELVSAARPGPAPLPDRRRGFLARTFRWLKRMRPARKLFLEPPIARSKESAALAPAAASAAASPGQDDRIRPVRAETVSGAAERCRALESHFLQNMQRLAAAEIASVWTELAAAYDAAGNHADAALCWLNASWSSPKWAWEWLVAEAKAARTDVKRIDPLVWLANPATPGTTRAMAAWVVWASAQNPRPTALVERAADLQARLAAHEHWLPVRAAWLACTSATRAGFGDVLAMARTRDRIAERLLAAGLSLDLDMPSFLRFAGEGVHERFHDARNWLKNKQSLIHQWIARLPAEAPFPVDPVAGPSQLRRYGLEPDVAHTRAYADLILAWGLTRFAEYSVADSIRKQAIAALPGDDPVHAILRDAFEYRIGQVRNGEPPRGALPAAIRAQIDALSGAARYAIDRLREHSRILEPTERVEGTASIVRRVSSTVPAPAARLEAAPADQLDDAVVEAISAESARPGQPHLLSVVEAALDRAAELGETGVGRVLEAIPAALEAGRDSPRPLARLIQKGLAAATFWDRADLARELTKRFLRLTDGRAGWDHAETLTGQAFRCLRRLGLKGDADEVLHHVADRVLQGQPLDRLRTSRPADWPAALRLLLHAAAGWYYAGRENDELARRILDEARRDLFAAETTPADRTKLALAYAATLGQAPVQMALARLEEMFRDLRRISVTGSTNDYYTLQPLRIIETAVRAVVSEDFAVGPHVRAWLDADELAVRRRIRDDLKEVMARQGL
jgi:hypothetical protein